MAKSQRIETTQAVPDVPDTAALEQRAWEIFVRSCDANCTPNRMPAHIAGQCFKLAEAFEQVAAVRRTQRNGETKPLTESSHA